MLNAHAILNAQLIRARLVWPVLTPPIENGALLTGAGGACEFGVWSDLASRHPSLPVRDLGEVALMPALRNAHCHLDYTNMAGKIAPPKSFTDWIAAILALKAHWSYTEYAESWVKGAKQLYDTGCAFVDDIEAVPELLPEAWQSTPLRVNSFFEMTGVRSGHAPESILNEALANISRLPDPTRGGLSPHALYSTPPSLLRLASDQMRQDNIRVSIHLAESRAEWEMYHHASGPLYDWLKNQRRMDDCGGRSPVQQAHRHGLLHPNLLAIHCNHLAPGDAELLAENQVTVVHCPRSHAYFQHNPFPYEELRRAGAKIALGTDSLASLLLENGRAPTLNMWEELRAFAKKHPLAAPDEIFRMAANPNSGRWISVDFEGAGANLAEALLHLPGRFQHHL